MPCMPLFFKPHYLQYLSNAVADRGSGSKGEVDHAEGHTETARGLLRNKLAHARYLEGGLFIVSATTSKLSPLHCLSA